MRTWQLQDAKARLSEVVKKAEKEGPQGITVHGHSAAVVLSSKADEKLKQPRGSVVASMRQSPLDGVELDVNRCQTPPREADVA